MHAAAMSYAAEHGSDYFADLHRVHASLGLAIPCPRGVRAFASLTPIKEKEILLLGQSLEDEPLHLAVARALQGYTRSLGVRTFNVAFYLPPIAPTGEDWSSFPSVVHLVDRGDPTNRTSDIGAMELYAASVVASDPFEVAGTFGEGLL